MLVPARRAWQAANHTYASSMGLSPAERINGLLTLAGLFSSKIGMVGTLSAFATPFVTLSSVVT